MVLTKDFQFTSFLAPGLVIIEDKTFIIPGWHEVPNGTTVEEVYKHWKPYFPVNSSKRSLIKINDVVISSKGDKHYKVAYDGMWWNCECSGFGFRKKCHHVDEMKIKHNMI